MTSPLWVCATPIEVVAHNIVVVIMYVDQVGGVRPVETFATAQPSDSKRA